MKEDWGVEKRRKKQMNKRMDENGRRKEGRKEGGKEKEGRTQVCLNRAMHYMLARTT
jgi:hypothetical protein